MNIETEVILNKLRNVMGVEEFQPIIKMCEDWLSQSRDESKYEKTNLQLLEECMNTTWLPMGWVERFTCKYVTKFDFMEETEKAKCWEDCVINYIKNEKKKDIKI